MKTAEQKMFSNSLHSSSEICWCLNTFCNPYNSFGLHDVIFLFLYCHLKPSIFFALLFLFTTNTHLCFIKLTKPAWRLHINASLSILFLEPKEKPKEKPVEPKKAVPVEAPMVAQQQKPQESAPPKPAEPLPKFAGEFGNHVKKTCQFHLASMFASKFSSFLFHIFLTLHTHFGITNLPTLLFECKEEWGNSWTFWVSTTPFFCLFKTLSYNNNSNCNNT